MVTYYCIVHHFVHIITRLYWWNGTHVTIRVSRLEATSYIGRKQCTSRNELIVVDFILKFTYVFAAHDESILADGMARGDGINIRMTSST